MMEGYDSFQYYFFYLQYPANDRLLDLAHFRMFSVRVTNFQVMYPNERRLSLVINYVDSSLLPKDETRKALVIYSNVLKWDFWTLIQIY